MNLILTLVIVYIVYVYVVVSAHYCQNEIETFLLNSCYILTM